MTTTKVTTLSDLFWVAANEYLAEPTMAAEDNYLIDPSSHNFGRRFSCNAVEVACRAYGFFLPDVEKILKDCGVPIKNSGWMHTYDNWEEVQLGRYTLLLFLSLYCEDEGI